LFFYRFKFRVSTSQITLTSSPVMSGPSSLNLNPLDYQVRGERWSLNKSCNRSQNQFPSLKNALSPISQTKLTKVYFLNSGTGFGFCCSFFKTPAFPPNLILQC